MRFLSRLFLWFFASFAFYWFSISIGFTLDVNVEMNPLLWTALESTMYYMASMILFYFIVIKGIIADDEKRQKYFHS